MDFSWLNATSPFWYIYYQPIFLSVKSQEGFIKCLPIIIMNIYIDLLNQPAAWKLGEAGFAFLSQIVFLLSLYVWLLYNRFYILCEQTPVNFQFLQQIFCNMIALLCRYNCTFLRICSISCYTKICLGFILLWLKLVNIYFVKRCDREDLAIVSYCVSKKSYSFLYGKSLHQNGQDFFDILYERCLGWCRKKLVYFVFLHSQLGGNCFLEEAKVRMTTLM